MPHLKPPYGTANLPLTPVRFKKRAATLFAGKIGVVDGNKRFTYREFDERTNRLSNALNRLGVKQGSRVAFIEYNSHRLLEAYYGVTQIGAILSPLNIRLFPSEFSYIINNSEAEILFINDEFYSRIVEPVKNELKTMKIIVLMSDEEKPRIMLDEAKEYEALLAEAPSYCPEVKLDENDVAELFYTSGTTGTPKGAMMTHRCLYLHALNSIPKGMMDYSEDDVQLHTIPLFHVNGWGVPHSLTCMGGTHVMLKKFDPKLVLETIGREKVTKIFLVPTMLRMLLSYPELGSYDLSSLRLMLIGGAPAESHLIREGELKFRCTVKAAYGLTETLPLLTVSTPKSYIKSLSGEEKWKLQSKTGLPVLGVEIRVASETGVDVSWDGKSVGEIIVRGDHLFLGYWNKPAETAESIVDGWFHTGDMAVVDEEGYVLIVDRKKDIIISGGENISSVEIEKTLYEHPAVYECAVIATPDEKWGEIPKAIVVLREGVTITADELTEFCRDRMAHFKAPKVIEFVKELPKSATGKIIKRKLRGIYG